MCVCVCLFVCVCVCVRACVRACVWGGGVSLLIQARCPLKNNTALEVCTVCTEANPRLFHSSEILQPAGRYQSDRTPVLLQPLKAD